MKIVRFFLAGLCSAAMLVPAFPALAENWTLQGSNIYSNNAGNVGIGTTSPSQLLTVGNNNQFTVSSAGNVNTSGVYQVGGNTALWLSPDSSSVGIGAVPGAFNGNYTGANSFFAGSLSGARVTSGTENLLMGALSGWNITDAGYNVGIGTSALRNNVHGNQNTAVGWGAGYNSTGGTFTGIGYTAGNSVTSGQFDTYIGWGAGASSNGTISNATAIGKNANAQISNSLILGGTGINAVNVGIGTTTPSQALDVQGNIHLTGNIVSDGDICIGTCP
jgi:hypothetical protein